MPPNHRRWWDRQHRQDCRIAVPIGIIALANGYAIPSWPMAISVLGGALFGAALCYIIPLHR